MSKVCSYCGHDNLDGTIFCQSCKKMLSLLGSEQGGNSDGPAPAEIVRPSEPAQTLSMPEMSPVESENTLDSQTGGFDQMPEHTLDSIDDTSSGESSEEPAFLSSSNKKVVVEPPSSDSTLSLSIPKIEEAGADEHVVSSMKVATDLDDEAPPIAPEQNPHSTETRRSIPRQPKAETPVEQPAPEQSPPPKMEETTSHVQHSFGNETQEKKKGCLFVFLPFVAAIGGILYYL